MVFYCFFKFNSYLFSTDTESTNKLDDGIPVTHDTGDFDTSIFYKIEPSHFFV